MSTVGPFSARTAGLGSDAAYRARMAKRAHETAVYTSKFDPSEFGFSKERLHRDASVRQLGDNGLFPGASYQLRIALDADPETGTEFDVDGDRALDRIEIYGAQLHLRDASFQVTGFVAVEDRDGHKTGAFELVRWHQVPFAWVAERDAKRERNATKADELSDEDKTFIQILREHQLSAADNCERWFELPDREPVEVDGFAVSYEQAAALRKHALGELTMIIADERPSWNSKLRREATRCEIALTTIGEDMADALLAARATTASS